MEILQKPQIQKIQRQLSSRAEYQNTLTTHRLELLAELIDDKGFINYKSALDEVFEGNDQKKKQNLLNKFKEELTKTAKGINIELALKADGKKKSSPEERNLWFEGDDQQKSRVIKAQEAVTRQPESELRNLAMPENRKKRVRYFVSYAHLDKAKAIEFLRLFKAHAATNPKYIFEQWIDEDIIIGKQWRNQIIEALQDCDFGLLILTPHFFDSKFITETELPHFIKSDSNGELLVSKSFVPIGVGSFDLSGDLKGLNEFQIYRWDSVQANGLKFFAQVRGDNKNQFVIQFLRQLTTKLDSEWPLTPGVFDNAELDPTEGSIENELLLDHKVLKYAEHHRTYDDKPQLKSRARYQQKFSKSQEEERYEEGQRALDLLMEWENKPDVHLFALLGQFGMGKTFTSLQYSRFLLQKYEEGKHDFIPFYFDLRDVNIQTLEKDFKIEDIIQSMLFKKQAAAATDPLTKEEFFNIWKTKPTLLIIDGIDEVLPHLKARKTESRFLDEIWTLIPDFRDALNRNEEQPDRKMVITCRTDYFKNVIDLAGFFKGDHRKQVDETKDYEIAYLLPFTEEQVVNYLGQAFPERDPREVYKVLEDIHNLAELSSRPVLIDFISEIIEELEVLAKRRSTLNTAQLYETLVEKTFTRDAGKHEIPQSIKLNVLEHIAAMLWRRKTRRIKFEALEDFLCETLDSGTRAMKKLFASSELENLYKDLRNATLLVRSTDTDFGFSHTSIQEYFLARYLMTQAKKGAVTKMLLPELSAETLDFLIDLLETSDQEDRLDFEQSWHELLGQPFDMGYYWAFALYLKLQQQQSDLLQKPPVLNLEGIYLRHGRLKGTPSSYLDLQNANLVNANLEDAQLDFVDLSGARLDNANLNNTRLEKVNLSDASMKNASACGQLRGINADNVNLEKASLCHLHLLNSTWPDQQKIAQPAHTHPKKTIDSRAWPVSLPAHFSAVRVAVISPDGKSIASASDDNTIKLWDVNNKKLIHSFEAHQDWVTHCQFSPDGKSIASASYDGTLRRLDLALKNEVIYYHFNDRSYAIIHDDQLLEYSKRAERHLRWQVEQPDGSKDEYFFEEVETDLAPVDA